MASIWTGLHKIITFCKIPLVAWFAVPVRSTDISFYRCMEHAIHIACKHFVEAVAPTSPRKFKGKANAANQPSDGPSANEEESSDDEFTPGDALGKALALVKQVSPWINIYHIL